MNKKVEGDGGGQPPKKDFPVPPKPPENPPADPPAPPAGDPNDKLDELGYEKPKPETPVPGDKKPEGDKPPETPPEKPKEVEPGTGYGAEEPKVEDPPAGDPPAGDPPPPPPTDLEKKLEGLDKTFADHVKKQITELGLEGDKLDKFIEMKRNDQKAAIVWRDKQQRDAVRQEQLRRQQWHKELKEDPVFGGDKFMTNVSRSEKVLDEWLPELKKELTEAKQVLRPSVMRGLARLADQLYPDTPMVTGEPPAPEKPDDNKPNDPLAFYT